MSEAQPNPWVEEVEQAVTECAYALNYDEGVQCHVLPLRSQDGQYTWEIQLEMTHSGHPFDLTWLVHWTDHRSDGIRFELAAPPNEGGVLWSQQLDSVDQLTRNGQVLSVFIRGYFVGRESVTALQAGEGTTD